MNIFTSCITGSYTVIAFVYCENAMLGTFNNITNITKTSESLRQDLHQPFKVGRMKHVISQTRWTACQYFLEKCPPSRMVGFSITSVGHFQLLYHLFVCKAKDNVRLAFSPAICGFQWKEFTLTQNLTLFCFF